MAYKRKQTLNILTVPKDTEMFEEDVANGALLKHLTRTWIIFFEKLAKRVGAGGSQIVEVTANMAVAFPAVVGTDIIPHKIIQIPGVPFGDVSMNVKFPNTGDALQVDIRLVPADGSDTASIFKDGALLVNPDGGATFDIVTQGNFRDSLRFKANDILLFDFVTVGSDYPGKVVDVTLQYRAD